MLSYKHAMNRNKPTFTWNFSHEGDHCFINHKCMEGCRQTCTELGK